MARKREPQTKLHFNATDERWYAMVYMGMKPDGKPDRRHRSSKDRAKLVDAVLKLEDARSTGTVPPVGKHPKAGQWWKWWIQEVAPLRAGHNTLRGTYGFSLNHLVPRRGNNDLDALTAASFDSLYAELLAEGLSPKSISHIHTTAVASLEVARTYGYVTVNVARGATPPSVRGNSPRALNRTELARVLPVIDRRPTPARWYLALLGARQGEALGARWSRLDFDTGMLSVVSRLERRTYTHGCADPVACAAEHCRTADCPGRVWAHGCRDPRECARPHCNRAIYPSEAKRPRARSRGGGPCPPGCTGHARACPHRTKGECRRHTTCVPCPAGCTGHAVKCPDRVGGLILVEPDQPAARPTEVLSGAATRTRGRRRSRDKALPTKTEAGTRRAALPPFVLGELAQHRDRQGHRRSLAGSKWVDNDLIICDDFGRPIDPRRDWEEWGEILDEAGVEYRELHAARKTAATFMLMKGMDRRIVMAYFGWASEAMLKTYQDVPDELLMEAAAAVGTEFRAEV